MHGRGRVRRLPQAPGRRGDARALRPEGAQRQRAGPRGREPRVHRGQQLRRVRHESHRLVLSAPRAGILPHRVRQRHAGLSLRPVHRLRDLARVLQHDPVQRGLGLDPRRGVRHGRAACGARGWRPERVSRGPRRRPSAVGHLRREPHVRAPRARTFRHVGAQPSRCPHARDQRDGAGGGGRLLRRVRRARSGVRGVPLARQRRQARGHVVGDRAARRDVERERARLGARRRVPVGRERRARGVSARGRLRRAGVRRGERRARLGVRRHARRARADGERRRVLPRLRAQLRLGGPRVVHARQNRATRDLAHR